ncbi:MAG: transposase [Candidatus Brocadiaceae bacterium]
MAKLSGCVPVVKESGKWKRLSALCLRKIRRTFHDWAFTSISCSSWARILRYHKKRNQKHNTILRNLGKKWIKILFAIWLQRTTYNETLLSKPQSKKYHVGYGFVILGFQGLFALFSKRKKGLT